SKHLNDIVLQLHHATCNLCDCYDGESILLAVAQLFVVFFIVFGTTGIYIIAQERWGQPTNVAEQVELCYKDAQAESNVFNIQSNSQWNDVVRPSFFMYPKCPEGSFASLLELLCASWDICILLKLKRLRDSGFISSFPERLFFFLKKLIKILFFIIERHD
ncbi:hypothetical protein ACJX0J_026204, partial [Zea mays]